MANTAVRVVGSGFTTFNYNGHAIAFLEGVEDSGQKAFSDQGQGYQFIHPLNDSQGKISRHPIEIATSRVLAGGTLMLTIRELWNKPVWNQLYGLAGVATGNAPANIVDVFAVLAATPQYVNCTQIITPPTGPKRGKVYNNCVVVDIQDGDTITIGALAVTKGITVAYTHSSKLI